MTWKILICSIFMSLIFSFTSIKFLYSSINSLTSLENVIYIGEPETRLIFEFSTMPKFEISKNDSKLIIKISNSTIKNTNWIANLPKNIFKEFNIALDNQNVILEFNLFKNFQISSEIYENKLIINLIWNEGKKISHARIIRNKIETSSISDLSSQTLPNWERQDNIPIALPLSGNYTGAPISVDFQDADLKAVMRLFAEVGKINILLSDPINATITMRVNNVPWDLLFDAILNSFGLVKMNLNNIIVVRNIGKVKTETELIRDYMKSLREAEEAGPLITKIFHLKYAKAKEIANKISLIIGRLDEVKATQREAITIRQEERGARQEVTRIELTIGRHGEKGSITFDDSTQLVIVKTTPKLMQEIEKAIRALDRPAPQILIEARIVEVSDTYVHSFGVRWGGGAYRLTEKTLLGIGNLPRINRTDTIKGTERFGDLYDRSRDLQSRTINRDENQNQRTQGTFSRESDTLNIEKRNMRTTETSVGPNKNIEEWTRPLPDGTWTGEETRTIQSGSRIFEERVDQNTSTKVTETGSSFEEILKSTAGTILENILSDAQSFRSTRGSTQDQERNFSLNLPTGPLIDLGLDPSKPASKIGFSVGYLGKSLMIIDLELHALEEKGYARIFAKPRIVTTNNHPAEFKQGYKIPYLEVTGERVATTKFIEAVMGLRVTPHITPDNRIFMDVEVERTLPDWTRTVQGVPPLYTTLASTRVLVNSGETFVIGGIRLDDVRDTSEGIPWLSNIPGAGNLFKRTGKSTSKSEFMVFITPRIITAEVEGVDY